MLYNLLLFSEQNFINFICFLLLKYSILYLISYMNLFLMYYFFSLEKIIHLKFFYFLKIIVTIKLIFR